MNLLYFTNIPSPYKVEFLNQLSKHMEVDVLFDGYDEDGRNDKWYKDNKYLFNPIFIKNFKTINKTIKKHYDIILIGTYATIYGGYLIELLHLKKIPFLMNADGGFVDKNDTFITKFLKTFFISKASYYLSSSKETNKYLTAYGANKDKIYLYNFTSLNNEDILDKPISYKNKLPLRKQKGYNYHRLFISIGNFIERKGYDLFFKAIKDNNFKDACFLIVGGGPLKKEYEKLIKEYKLNNVYLIDFLDKKEIFEYLQMSDVFFFPSREDIWGLVINEAMANGLPVISSDNVIASKELVESKYLYDPNDLNKQYALINEFVYKTDDELYTIGQVNLNKIKDYTIENMVKRHLEIFNEVANGK